MTLTDTLDAIERPRVVEVTSGLHAVVFDLIKIAAARHILRDANRRLHF